MGETTQKPDYDASGRPSSERDGTCICDYNPDTTDGPQEDCPFHGRPYAYWIERGDALAERLAAVERVLDGRHPMPYCSADGRIVVELLAKLRDALSRPATTGDHP